MIPDVATPDVVTPDGPPVRGFAVTVGDSGTAPAAGGCAPAFLTTGPVREIAGAGLRGWAVTGPDAAAPDAALARTGVLLCGELYHRDRLLDTIGGEPDGDSDADLVAHAWRTLGRGGLRLLNGRFAAVILAGGDRAALLVTDHAGGVPLFVAADRGRWHVATEAKCLRGDDGRPVPGTRPTPRRPGVRQVRGATAVELPGVAEPVRSWPTWTPPQHRSTVAADVAAVRLRGVLDDAVRTRIGPGCAVVLSGGVDSGAVTALAARHTTPRTITMGTEVADEFAAARAVAEHVGTDHHEVRLRSADVTAALPWAVAAAEIVDAEVVEYLLPLVALYRRLPPTRLLTGYGADIPLGGMHRQERSPTTLDETITAEIAEVDVLNEMSPVVGGFAGHWATHPYWDREVLDLLLGLPATRKLRDGTDKWVLRAAVAADLPAATAYRAKLGVHEGSGSQSAWTAALREHGVPADAVAAAKTAVVAACHDEVVARRVHPADVDLDALYSTALYSTALHSTALAGLGTVPGPLVEATAG